MAGPIQTIPQGLLGLLQLKEVGVNPSSLVQFVAPQIDLTPLYLQRIMVSEQQLFPGGATITGVTAHGQQIFQVGGVNQSIPQNEMWYVYEMTVGGNLAAADVLRFAPGFFTSLNIGNMIQVGQDYNDVVTARAREYSAGNSYGPFFAPPGASFAVRVLDATSVPGITFNLQMRASRLPI